jgi:hypothetical protein
LHETIPLVIGNEVLRIPDEGRTKRKLYYKFSTSYSDYNIGRHQRTFKALMTDEDYEENGW